MDRSTEIPGRNIADQSLVADAAWRGPLPEAVVRHIPLVPLLALLIILANFTIFFELFT